MRRSTPEACIVVPADLAELPHVPMSAALFSLHAVVPLPATAARLASALTRVFPQGRFAVCR